jgi:hypothetical protein
MKKSLILLFVFTSFALQAQSVLTFERSLKWRDKPIEYTFSDGTVTEMWRFDPCSVDDATPTLPVYAERFALPGKSKIAVEIQSVQYESFSKTASPDDQALSADLTINTSVQQERRNFWGLVSFIPVRKIGNRYERAVRFTLVIRITPDVNPVVTDRNGPFATSSVLKDGALFKFGVASTAVYKLDYDFLKNKLGVSNIDNIDPRNIRIYGNGGAMVPEKNSDQRNDDLIENAIFVSGESDGKFNNGDFILFYATGPDVMSYRPSTTDPQLTVTKNLYDRYAWYFIKIDNSNGLRISDEAGVPASVVTEQFDDFNRLEDEKVNLLDVDPSGTGSGKRWFGDYFLQTRDRSYTFNFDNIAAGSTARIRSEFAGRSGLSSVIQMVADGKTFTQGVSGVTVSNNELPYAANAVLKGTFTPAGNQVHVDFHYPEVSVQSEGWLDYVELNVRRKLTMAGQFMEFRDLQTLTQDATIFRLSGVNTGLTIWDITAPRLPQNQVYTQTGNIIEFGATTKNQLRSYIAFANNATFPKPETFEGHIANQNVHALDNVDMVIVYHPDFEAQVKQLADHRRTYSGLDVATLNVHDIYNEFSSGAKDPAAIRDFARMLLERNPVKFKYMLLFGDGSFDPKNNTNSTENKDYIPVYETAESFDPIRAYPSDDFFALLSPDEGGVIAYGMLDISVGRITARNADDAQVVVDKIIAYDKKPETLGDWHERALYMADDEDGSAHIDQADALATRTANTESWFNVEKVYFDAYQQISTSAGQRFPDAKTAINSEVFKGMLVMQYIGHGGPRGWAQERVIDNNDIAGWDNPNRYPLIITATCSFGGYDDYTTLTGGEQALLKVKSGAIALFTTVRAVYISGNNILTDAVQNVIFKRVNGKYLTIGDILRTAKNMPSISGPGQSDNTDNARRFTLLGDPAMYLALPEYRVATTKVNGHAVVAGKPDTLKALMPVDIEGMVTDTMGKQLTGFNGKVYVTIFDKAQNLQTLGQDPSSYVRTFSVQRNAIFKGSATVANGAFKISFIVPKDINYTYGAGKISYYAENGTPLDAAGGDRNIIVGGNANLIKDDQPPLVQAFLNTDAFVYGGITNRDPKLLVKCSDDHGMNVTGVSLGHDLTAVLDDNVLETIVLNDFYESEKDNFRKGQAFYPLRNLAPGRHKLRVKGWDIANNAGEGYTEFVVAEDGKAALAHVLNYPNPFTTNTSFQFEHNLAGQVLDVQIHVFTVSGRLVKTIMHSAPADGFRVTDINWDGKDEYGDILARGVYLYKIKIRGLDAVGTSVSAESAIEKLVILK